MDAAGIRPSRTRESSRQREPRPGPRRDARRAAFGTFVRRALTEARKAKLTIANIEATTGVSKSTFYRWRDADWTRDPRPEQVKAFCDGLVIPYQAAYKVLGWSEHGPAEGDTMPPDFQVLLRRLRDPSVATAEKYLIKETIRGLAARDPERRDRQDRTG